LQSGGGLVWPSEVVVPVDPEVVVVVVVGATVRESRIIVIAIKSVTKRLLYIRTIS
jgi:hypothetical protein